MEESSRRGDRKGQGFSDTEERLFEITECYLDGLHAGNAPTQWAIRAENPDILLQLDERLQFTAMMFGMGMRERMGASGAKGQPIS